MNKQDKANTEKIIKDVESMYNHTTPIYTLAQYAKQLLEEVPNFLKLKKMTNPTTGRTLEYIDKRPAVVVLVTNEERTKGIFVKQFRAGSNGQIYECPAGVIEPNQSPIVAVHAELRQEIGLDPDDILELQEVAHTYSSVGWANEEAYLYHVIVDENVQLKEQQLDEGECLTYEWLTFEEVLNKPENKIMPLATYTLIQSVRVAPSQH